MQIKCKYLPNLTDENSNTVREYPIPKYDSATEYSAKYFFFLQTRDTFLFEKSTQNAMFLGIIQGNLQEQVRFSHMCYSCMQQPPGSIT